MDDMTARKKTDAQNELFRIEEALVQSILDASESELREEIAAAGQDPDKCIAEFDALVDRAKAACAKQRLERAKTEVAAWRSGKGKVVDFDREAVRARFENIRARDPELASKMMMAARKGEGISDRDMEGWLEDLAKLDRLEREEGEE
jgi:hypothetical protein